MKYVAIVIAGLLAIALISGWSSSSAPAPRPVRLPPTVTTVQHHSYRLGESEHMVLIDIPDKYVPRRCMVYVNELTRSSLLNCNFDSVGESFPQATEE